MDIFGKTPPALSPQTIYEIEHLKSFNFQRLKAAAELFNALAHKIRYRILEIIREKKW